MQLQDILFTQGFGTRRICAGLIQQGYVRIGGQVQDDPSQDFETPGLVFNVRGEDWPFRDKAYVLMHKPEGYECSQRPSAWPSIYTLLPAPLRQRPRKGSGPGVQAIGRLDQDTTGLLLVSDDGIFIHRMSSPRGHVPKVYGVTTADPVTSHQIEELLGGVVLDDDPRPVRAAACEARADNELSLTLTEGKYHQVKRMIAAVGNRVVALHRSRIGGLVLPTDLAPGHWRWLTPADIELLSQSDPGKP